MCLSGNTTIYIVLNLGSTNSLITLQEAQRLRLNIQKTQHPSIQEDGQSSLKVIGETYTTFYIGQIPLKFSALMVANMPMDILGGIHLHKENDISAQMTKNTISIGDICTVKATQSLKEIDETRLRPAATTRTISIIPGE